MAHTSEKRWNNRSGVIGVANQVTVVATNARDSILAGEESYNQLLELYAYVGNTAQGLADQLFYEDWNARAAATVSPDVPETEANAEEVAKAQDIIDAMTALHEIFQAANNVSVAQSDRLSDLRRMI